MFGHYDEQKEGLVSMLLVIDVGNSNTVLGIYQGDELKKDWRVGTDKNRTVDEYAMLINNLFSLSGLSFSDLDDVIVSCVVPPMLNTLERLC